MQNGPQLLRGAATVIVVLVALGALWYVLTAQEPSTPSSTPATQTAGYKKLSSVAEIGTLGFDAEIPVNWEVRSGAGDVSINSDEPSIYWSPDPIYFGEEGPVAEQGDLAQIPFHVGLLPLKDGAVRYTAKDWWDQECAAIPARHFFAANCSTRNLDGVTAYIVELTTGRADVTDAQPGPETFSMYIDHPAISDRSYSLMVYKKYGPTGIYRAYDFTQELNHFLDTFQFSR